MKTAVIDIDGVICEERPTFERSLAAPTTFAREAISTLAKSGYRIILHTARSWSEYEVTVRWLYDNGIFYDSLVMGKPVADIVVDDRSVKTLEEAVNAIG
jgi:uncharacterized HAD superfamily protein